MSDRTPVVVGLAFGLLVGILGALVVVRLSTGPTDATASPAQKAVVAGTAYTGDAEEEARLVQLEAQRLVYVRTVAATAQWNAAPVAGAYRVRTGATYTLVLPARAEPYTVTDLEALAPDTFQRQPGGAYLLTESILVLGGATLTLKPADDSDGLRLRLKSDDDAFVSIVTSGGALAIDGRADAPVSFESWNVSTGSRDVDTADGRAYLRVIAGRAQISHANFAGLGFWSGNTGGLALTGTDASAGFDSLLTEQATDDTAAVSGAQILPAGTVPAPDAGVPASFVSAALDHVKVDGNAFGVFVTSADNVTIRDTAITNSLVDGLVFHRFVTNSAVRNTRSVDNAVDGFSVARSSTNLSFNDVVATGNGRDGVALDGQPLAEGPSATGTAVQKFGDNRVTGSTISDNGRYGIAVSGGRDIVLSSNVMRGNESGIVVDHAAADVQIVANRFVNQARQAVAIRDDVARATVVTNRVTGGDTAVYVRNAQAKVEHNSIAEVSNHGVTLVGDASKATVTANTIAGFGSIPIFLDLSKNGTVLHNDTLDWHAATNLDTVINAIFQPLTIVWIALAVIVLGTALSPASRRSASIHHPYADQAPLSTFTRGIVSRESIREVHR